MSGSGREVLPDVQEWSGGPPGCLGVVGSPSKMSGSGREAPQMSGSGQESLKDVREWSRGLRISGSVRVDLLYVR